jgi:hypothetical protein
MAKILHSGAAEIAPTTCHDECWYLPLFGVYHPRKPNKLRGVFDSFASYQGISLNSLLMSGPDLVNSLLEILLSFRKDEIAITADVEQMFYQFRVNESDRDFPRFFWYKNNDPKDILIEYRMCVHVFGNCGLSGENRFKTYRQLLFRVCLRQLLSVQLKHHQCSSFQAHLRKLSLLCHIIG